MPFVEPNDPDVTALRARKSAVRLEMRERLARLDDRAARSAQLCTALAAHPAWKHATMVGMFAPLKEEPNIELLRARAIGKALCYPVIQGDTLHFIAVTDSGTLVRGIRGVRQPPFDPEQVISIEQLGLILVPGAAFSPSGQRLGRGGGFYDRLLATPELRALKMGVCFDCQLFSELPREPHDQEVDCVVTESGVQGR